ncbi:hypothetical protein PF003_g24318 [Phytophthora fragariae]|nr:hypothetical protein PF003_g24318 [Phytophthora fragariae]
MRIKDNIEDSLKKEFARGWNQGCDWRKPCLRRVAFAPGSRKVVSRRLHTTAMSTEKLLFSLTTRKAMRRDHYRHLHGHHRYLHRQTSATRLTTSPVSGLQCHLDPRQAGPMSGHANRLNDR